MKSILRTMMKTAFLPDEVVNEIMPLGKQSVFRKGVKLYNEDSAYDVQGQEQGTRVKVLGHEFKQTENPLENVVAGGLQTAGMVAAGALTANPLLIKSGIQRGISTINKGVQVATGVKDDAIKLGEKSLDGISEKLDEWSMKLKPKTTGETLPVKHVVPEQLLGTKMNIDF